MHWKCLGQTRSAASCHIDYISHINRHTQLIMKCQPCLAAQWLTIHNTMLFKQYTISHCSYMVAQYTSDHIAIWHLAVTIGYLQMIVNILIKSLPYPLIIHWKPIVRKFIILSLKLAVTQFTESSAISLNSYLTTCTIIIQSDAVEKTTLVWKKFLVNILREQQNE